MAERKIIGHLDMDAFFAAVEERENPRWRGRPIVVGADPPDGQARGVVSTASYPARAYGIRSGMPISRAWRLSEQAAAQDKPRAIFLPGNFRLYGQISKQLMNIVRRYSPSVEQGSIDEVYFDLSVAGTYKKAEAIARQLKAEIKAQTRLTCSLGLGPNKLIAKIAAGRNKPDGLMVVRPEEVLAFLAPLAVRELPGIGPKTGQRLAKKGIHSVSDLRQSDEAALKPLAYGVGSTELTAEWTAKSIGEQETFAADTLKARFLYQRLTELAGQVLARFRRSEFKSFRTIVLTVRFSDFQTFTRSRTFPRSQSGTAVLESEALKLLLPFLDHRANPSMKPIRLLGVRIEKLL